MRWNKKADVAVDESTENIMYYVIGIPIVLIMIGMAFSLTDRADISTQLDLQSNFYEFMAMSSVRQGKFFYAQNNENYSIDQNYISYNNDFVNLEIPVFVNKDTDNFDFDLSDNLEFSRNSISLATDQNSECQNKLPKKINVIYDFAYQNERSNSLKNNIDAVLKSNGYDINSDYSFKVLFRDYELLNSRINLFEDTDVLVKSNSDFCGDFFITDLADIEVQIANEQGLYIVGEFFDE